MSKAISLPEAAAVLGISKASAYRLAARNEFPVAVIRLGRSIRVSRAALDRLLEVESFIEDSR